jgi:hypothetical protein
MRRWQSYGLGLLAGAGLASGVWAQIPAVPVVPVAPVVAAPVVAAPAAAPANLWTFLCPTQEKLAACHARYCACPLGQLITSMMHPVAVFSGGILGNCCPPNAPNPADLALPSDTPAGAAAQIKADEANAAKRREAVRYLGTVDCHHWPEAQKALINALRADRNECVRLEAAIVLGRGCCCTKNTIIALSITVAGSDRDGNPSENCDRVRAAALASLNHCLACLADPVPLSLEPAPAKKGPPIEGQGPIERGPEKVAPPPPVPLPPTTGAEGRVRGDVNPVVYYEQVDKVPMKDIVAVARAVLNKTNAATKANITLTPAPEVAHPGAFNIIATAVSMNGVRSGNPASAGNAEPAPTNPTSTAAAPAAPAPVPQASLGGAERMPEETPRVSGLLVTLARRLAPTPLSEGQTEDSQFKTPPFFSRRSESDQVVYPTVQEQMPSPQLGTPSPVAVTAPVVVTSGTGTIVSTSTSLPPVTITPPPPPTPIAAPPVAPVMITTPVPMRSTTSPPAAKPAASPVVQASYLPNTTEATTFRPAVAHVTAAPVGVPTPGGGSLPPKGWTPIPPAVAPPVHVPEPTPTMSGLPQYVQDLIVTVRTGKSCEEGLAAVFSLANSDWKTHPAVVAALATAAKAHTMLPVRITAIRCLAGVRVNNAAVRMTLQSLKNDADPAVRSEAEQALNSLVFYTPPREISVMR